MKFFKPLLFAVAGFAIAFLVSFKNEEPKKEYATIDWYEGSKKEAIVFVSQSEVKKFSLEQVADLKRFIEVLNIISSEGWMVVNTETTGNTLTKRTIYLERTKP